MTATAIATYPMPHEPRPHRPIAEGYTVDLSLSDQPGAGYRWECTGCLARAVGFQSLTEADEAGARHRERRHPKAPPRPARYTDLTLRCTTCGGERHGDHPTGIGPCPPCRNEGWPLMARLRSVLRWAGWSW